MKKETFIKIISENKRDFPLFYQTLSFESFESKENNIGVHSIFSKKEGNLIPLHVEYYKPISKIYSLNKSK